MEVEAHRWVGTFTWLIKIPSIFHNLKHLPSTSTRDRESTRYSRGSIFPVTMLYKSMKVTRSFKDLEKQKPHHTPHSSDFVNTV